MLKKAFFSGAAGILAVGAAIQLLTGFPSAWGVFRQPVMDEFRLDGGAAAFAANCIVAAYGLGCVIGGFVQDHYSPKAAGLWGTILLGGGLTAAGFLPEGNAALFYLAFSLPVGLGCAFLYPAVMCCVQKWYKDRKGFATGLVGLGVGLSGLVLTLLVKWTVKRWGLRSCFWILAGLLFPLCGGGSFLLKDPPQTENAPEPEGMKPAQMFKTSSFWLAFLSMGFATPALLLFGPKIPELAVERGLSETVAEWLAAAGSAGSAVGRLLMPMAGERWGKRTADLWLFGLLTGLSAAFAFAGGWWAAAVYLALCFCYAGQMAVMPSLCTQMFGIEHTGINYGFIALGASLGSLGFPLLAQALGLETGRHFLAAAAALAGFFVIWKMNPEKQQKSSGVG